MMVRNSPAAAQQTLKAEGSQPYFMQGFMHARNVLTQLKRRKENEYSPLSKHYTKASKDPIIEDQTQHGAPSGQNASKNGQPRIIKSYTEEIQDSFVEPGLHATKVKPKESTAQNIKAFREQVRNLATHAPIAAQEQKQSQKGSVEWYQEQIDSIGRILKEVYLQTETYEIVLDNLCDLYRANQHIPARNQRLVKESIRLHDDRLEILNKVQAIKREICEVELAEKKANDEIAKLVLKYVEEVCAYNRVQQFRAPQMEQIAVEANLCVDPSDSQQEDYGVSLKLNYKKLKEKNEEKGKKKGLGEGKKLQKGISFEQQIDIVGKYYESEMSEM